jgi:hypothetical protein
MHLHFVNLPITLMLTAIGILNASPASAPSSGVAGTWRGESVCATQASACHNERVIYYVKDVLNRPDRVFIQADKIVDGKPITMGSSEWQYDQTRGTLEWRMPRQVWLLKITDGRMEGTLTLTDGTIFRNMTLEKDR